MPDARTGQWQRLLLDADAGAGLRHRVRIFDCDIVHVFIVALGVYARLLSTEILRTHGSSMQIDVANLRTRLQAALTMLAR